MAQTTLLKGGTVLDGTGAPAFHADVLIEDDLIQEVGQLAAPPDAAVLDCRDLMIAPGFIDAHSHSDLQVLQPRFEKVRQGVTSEVVGNCGFSPYPAAEHRKPLHDFANGIFCGDQSWGWGTAKDYLAEAAVKSMVNVESLVGHGTLRIWQAGPRQGPLGEKEVSRMCGVLAEALQEGSCGFSSGLMYAPGSSAPPEELQALCRVVARHSKLYATHMRNYSDRLVDATDEQLALARETGCRLQISHFQAVGKRNWHLQQIALDHIEQAARQGVDVAFDAYPYVRGSTVLTQILPQWSLDDGVQGLLIRLNDSVQRLLIADEANAELAQGWENIIISAVGSKRNAHVVGKSLVEIGELLNVTPVEAAFHLLIEEVGMVNILEINQSEDNLRQVLAHPMCNVISDGFYVTGKSHPRLVGTFPYLLGEISQARGWLTIEEAVRKVTDLPAQRLNMKRRGRIQTNYIADITIFDQRTINSAATYESPTIPPSGILHRFRSGLKLPLDTLPST